MSHYTLDDCGQPVPATDLLAWARWFETADRTVAKTCVPLKDGGSVLVSTVFLGTDHGFGRTERPVLWETMVFGPCALHHEQERYASRADALAGHAAMVDRVNACLCETSPEGAGP